MAKKNCITYGSCGETDVYSETSCLASQPPQKLSNDYVDILSAFCPELLEEFGNELCCDEDQVLSVGEKLGLASAFAGKCPSCLRNLRQMICQLVCSPNQHKFMNVTQQGTSTSLVHEDTKKPKLFAMKADIFLEEDYVMETFESCKGVTAGNGLILDFFCGKWKAAGCNAKRWFDYVGRAKTGVVSVDLKIVLVKDEGPQKEILAKNGITAYAFNTTTCDQPVAVCLHLSFLTFDIIRTITKN